jgi:hypothetical protein
MFVGGYLLQDISGPSRTIGRTAAYYYQFCVVYLANECVSGSSVGDVYVNVPQSAHNGMCGPWDYSRNICGATMDATSTGLNQYYFGNIPLYNGTSTPFNINAANVTNGQTFRRLSGMLDRYNFQSVFTSAHGSFGGQWVFAHSDNYGSGLRADLFLIKLPPLPPADNIARGQFVNLLVQVGPASDTGVNARIRFGYAENGPPTSFFCAYNRTEACITNPNPTAANPYYFASDSGQTTASCSAGCTVVLPAIAGRVVYYVIDRLDGSGNLINTSNLQIADVP